MRVGEGSYARILDNLHDGLYFVDEKRVVTYWSKGAIASPSVKAGAMPCCFL